MESPFLTSLQNNWEIIIAIVGVIWSYASLNSKVKNLHLRVLHLEENADRREEILIEIRERLASIEATLKTLTVK